MDLAFQNELCIVNIKMHSKSDFEWCGPSSLWWDML